MTSSGLVMWLFVLVAHISNCLAVDVEYSEKIVSDHKGDWFGVSLATFDHKLVIGAPEDYNSRGSVMVDKGLRVKGPAGGWLFGEHVDVSQQFMAMTGQRPYSVYVYQSHSPYDMVARFPMDGYVMSLAISDDNTIAVSHYVSNTHCFLLTIYQFDGSSTWNIVKNFKLEHGGYSLAVHGDILVVGVLPASLDRGYVQIFNCVGGEWTKGQTIKQQNEGGFGLSVAVYGQHMAVRGIDIVFTYMLDQHKNTWINSGKHSVPGFLSQVSIQNDLMVATINDMKNNPGVCGFVYKLTELKANNNNNNNNKINNGSVATTINNNHGDVVWKESSRLTTKGDPLTSRHQQSAISIEGKFVFTGRVDYRNEGFGKVFVHDLSNYNN